MATLGEVYADESEWRPSLEAYRASLALADDATVRETYESLRAEHGFRILNYTVDSDAAAPRICFQFSEGIAAKTDFTPYIAVSGAANAAVTAAVLISTPYVLDYDYVVLLAGIAFLWRDAERHGWLSWEKSALALVWIAPLVAGAYAAWFGLGATFGKSGGGRGWVLGADFLLGSVGMFGVLLPRGSAYNLIGLDAPLDVPQRAASGVLLAVTIVCLALGVLRCRR